MEPDLPTQLATLSGLAAPLIVSALRRYLAGKPKWMLPFLCAAIAVGISVASQLGAAAATGDDPSGWGMLFGVAMGGLGLLGRQMLHEAGSGETIPPPVPKPPTGPHLGPPPRRHGRLSGLALAVLLLGAPVVAQNLPRPLTPGDPVYYCSGDLRCNPGRTRDTLSVPAAPCDPWADGVFNTTSERCGDGRCEIPETLDSCAADCEGRTPVRSDLACWRHRYAYPKTTGWGLGNWCGQHGQECRAVGAAWRALVGGTGVPACESPGATGRAGCDAHMTAGATLGCHMLSCGLASCPPHEVRTCPTSGPCPTGWTCSPLLALPPERWRGADVPGGGIVQYYPTADPRTVCSYWIAPRALYINTARAACFEGLPADCQSFADLRLACWAPPEPPPPVCGDGTCEPGEVCPEDCAPPTLPVFALLDCGPVGWRLQAPGGEILPVAPGGEVELEVAGRFRLRVPEQCGAGDCPAGPILERVRAEACL
jgi:hypothetical protein